MDVVQRALQQRQDEQKEKPKDEQKNEASER